MEQLGVACHLWLVVHLIRHVICGSWFIGSLSEAVFLSKSTEFGLSKLAICVKFVMACDTPGSEDTTWLRTNMNCKPSCASLAWSQYESQAMPSCTIWHWLEFVTKLVKSSCWTKRRGLAWFVICGSWFVGSLCEAVFVSKSTAFGLSKLAICSETCRGLGYISVRGDGLVRSQQEQIQATPYEGVKVKVV